LQPLAHQFSFEIQRALPGDFLVSAGYVGSRSGRIPVCRQRNLPRFIQLSMKFQF
jgi:hypothetical protein